MRQTMLLLVFIASIGIFSLRAQSRADTLYHKHPAIAAYYQNGKKVIRPQLTQVLKTSPLAYEEYKKAQTNHFFGTFIGGAGGILIGHAIGLAVRDEKQNWPLALLGAGLIAVNIPIDAADRRHTREAVRLYNAGLQ